MSNSEPSQGQSNDQGANTGELKSLDDFKSLSLNDMEKELSSKDYSKPVNPLNLDQDNENSDTSDDASSDDNDADQVEEQASEEDSSVNSEDSTESDNSDSSADNQGKQKKESLEERFAKLEKQNKELQAEFTRRSQKLRELEKQLSERETTPQSKEESKVSDKKDTDRLAQLREKDPAAAEVLESIIREQAERIVSEKIKPVEEQVTLRRRQENTNKFNKGVEEFLNSPMKELEAEIVDIINENPSEWQRTIWEKDNAFELLKKELFYRHPEKVAKHIIKTEKSDNASSTKRDRLKASQVGTKTKVSQPSKDVMSREEFSKLSLEEMEKRLPKIRN